MSLQRRHGALSLIARLATIILVVAGFTLAATVTSAQAKVTNAVSTTTNVGASTGNGACLNGGGNGDPINCNLYSAKEDVWLSGLPTDLADGDYFLAVLAPGGQNDPNDGSADLLSSDIRDDRVFALVNGVITSTTGNHLVENSKIQLAPYADTPNPGGEYILAVCAVPEDPEADVMASDCKYDAFKIKTGDDTGYGPQALQVTKDADGAYDNTYTWSISKSADKTVVKQVGGSATFNYTVGVTHDGGAISNVTVTGTITVHNPNSADVTGVDVTDVLSDGTVCDVEAAGDNATIPAGADVPFDYSCDLSARPEGQLDNVATATWPTQDLGSKQLVGDFTDFTFSDIAFAENTIDGCVSVADSFAGSLGTVCVGDANPTQFTYSRTVPVPAYDCTSYDNTATFTTDDTGSTGSASQTVSVCGPAKTGALTMGFWQNNNGQGIIKAGSSTNSVCNSGTWLRQFAPFQNLSATASCSQVATYVYNAVKAANASGAAMNAMLKGQMLATALDVYFSDPALGGNKIGAPAPIGGKAIDLTKVCKNIATCTVYENTSSAFGGATSLTVSQLLTYAASQSNVGGSTWYGQVKATQELAKDTFDAINNQKAFGA
jgi:hypothetical protein